jgi:hypothetical protein
LPARFTSAHRVVGVTHGTLRHGFFVHDLFLQDFLMSVTVPAFFAGMMLGSASGPVSR